MENIKRYHIFSTVVETGSMTAAAKHLGMTPSAVSQNISYLENSLGMTLLYRSTRGNSLTEAGQILWKGYDEMRLHYNDLERKLTENKVVVQGDVRISCPEGIGQELLAHALKELFANNPKLTVNVISEYQLTDIYTNNIDIAIRVGKISDNNLVYRPLGKLRMALCASPDYLEEHGEPKNAEDLKNHHLLRHADDLAELQFLDKTGKSYRIKPKMKMVSNNVLVIRSFATNGYGLALLPIDLIREHMTEGVLKPVMADYEWPVLDIQALTVGRILPKRVVEVVNALKSYFENVNSVQTK